MPRYRRLDESAVLDRAARVFATHGYSGATIVMLCKAMKLAPASVYSTFGSKRGLFDAVATHQRMAQSERTKAALSASRFRDTVMQLLLAAQLNNKNEMGQQLQSALSSNNIAETGHHLHGSGLPNDEILGDLTFRVRMAILQGDLPDDIAAEPIAYFLSIVIAGIERLGLPEDWDDLARLVLRVVEGPSQAAGSSEGSLPTSPQAAPSVAQGRRGFKVDKALDAAMRLFWQKGYEGTSLSDLTAAMQISKPALYAAFGNKETLFLKVLDRYQKVVLGYAARALDAPGARSFVDELISGAIDTQLSGDHPRGCLWVINSMQGGDEAAVIRAEVLRRSKIGSALITARLEKARDDGDLPADTDILGLAQLLGAVLQAVTTVGATGGGAAELHSLRHTFMKVWPSATDR